MHLVGAGLVLGSRPYSCLHGVLFVSVLMGRCTGIMWYRHHGRREAEARWPTCRACLTSSAGGPRRKRRLRSSCAKINWGVAAAACARLLAVRVELAEMSICLAVLFLGFGSVKPAQHPASCAVWVLGVQMWLW